MNIDTNKLGPIFLFCTYDSSVFQNFMIFTHILLPIQSVPITTNVVSSNHVHGEVYSIQHYVKKLQSFQDQKRHTNCYFINEILNKPDP
jgi:hypothetical protein